MTPSAEPNIILAGFMGTGKSAIGREIARRLDRDFVDLDCVISKRAGKPVSAIFAQDGEAVFRGLESEACRVLATARGAVVATGGGAVLNPENRAALSAGGVILCLDASPEVIQKRVAGGATRPLLAGDPTPERVRLLLDERAPAYGAIPLHLDTSELTVAEAAERVMARVAGLPDGAHRLPIELPANAGSSYDVLIGPGLLGSAGFLLRAAGSTAGRCALVTTPPVAGHYAPTLQATLAAAGFGVSRVDISDGEVNKTLSTVAAVYAELAKQRLAREEPVVALGGGVVGDLTGFVAATWLRGVPFAQLPTSLLAMVDASVGGKVAVDLPEGKNLVGAFKQPVVVVVDPEVLLTLPEVELRCGLAEILKAGIIADPALFDRLEAQPVRSVVAQDDGDAASLAPRRWVPLIASAVRVKARVVERDPFEQGERALLNLGHTFGHALELTSGFGIRHGEGVALGMVAAAHLSHELGLCDAALPDRVRAAVAGLGLPVRASFDVESTYAAMGTDKKRRGRSLRFVAIEAIGRCVVVEDVPEPAIRAALQSIRSEK